MAGKSQAHTDAVLNVLRNVAVSAVAQPYVGLFSAAPANDGVGGTELSGNGYARQAVTFSAPQADTGNVRKIVNSGVITFGPASGNWAQAVAFGIFDASSAGTLLYWDVLTAAKTVESGDSAQFAAGALAVKED